MKKGYVKSGWKDMDDELCSCGCLKSEHAASVFCQMAKGHGACKKCSCKKFTWVEFVKKIKIEPESVRITVYCTYRGYYWHAQCTLNDRGVESKSCYHNSARQASDEVLGYVKAEYSSATMRRLSPKQYEITYNR